MSGIYHALGPSGWGTYRLNRTGHRLEPGAGIPDGILVPGFVDIHIHGGFGIDFMTASGPEMVEFLDRLSEVGYEGCLPTTVASSVHDVCAALANLPEDPRILGFHLEGPFLSPKFPGAQPPAAIVNPPVGASDWDAVLDDPRLRLITLAPELPEALGLIQRLSDRGVLVSLGHTNATFAEAEAAFAAGARSATHTYNAMRGLHHREAGMLGFALLNPDLWCELIYDHLHVSTPAARVLSRMKADRIIAISDSTLATGLPAGTRQRMWNLDVEIGVGQVRLLDGTLAGSGNAPRLARVRQQVELTRNS